MATLHNARIFQLDGEVVDGVQTPGKFELQYEDDDGATRTEGPFDGPDEAARKADELRAAKPVDPATQPTEQAGAVGPAPDAEPKEAIPFNPTNAEPTLPAEGPAEPPHAGEPGHPPMPGADPTHIG